MDMPDVDFRPFNWQPTDRYWTDVIYVQQRRQPVVAARTRPRSRSGPVRIVRHANICGVCNVERAERTNTCWC